MKNIFLFFFLFITLNAAVKKNDFTKEKIDDTVKIIKEISKYNYCDKNILRNKIQKFDLEPYTKNKLHSQLINVCNDSSKKKDKELFIRTIYIFLKKEIEVYEEEILTKEEIDEDYKDTNPDNGLGTYLCKKIMIFLGYDSSEC